MYHIGYKNYVFLTFSKNILLHFILCIQGVREKKIARKKCPYLIRIKCNCDMKPILPSQMNSWIFNAVYFSQFGCCNPELLQFFQEKSIYMYQ